MDLPAGTRLGPFQITGPIGRGGMGAVFAARAPDGGSAVVKVLAQSLAADPGFVRRFDREARAAAALVHPHLVRVLGAGGGGHQPLWIAFELVAGGSLADRLKKQGPQPWRAVVGWGAQVARALEVVHASGFVHRDLKPANVLLTADGEAKLADLGLVRATGNSGLGTSVALTRTGEVVGTLHYIAPEQADGQVVDGRADLYGLGATLYALLTGRPPFEGQGVALLKKHLLDRPLPPRSLVPDLPAEVDELVVRLLAKDPDERGRAGEVAAELEALHRDTKEAGRRPRQRTRWLAAGSCVAAAAAGLLVLFVRASTPEAPIGGESGSAEVAAAPGGIQDGVAQDEPEVDEPPQAPLGGFGATSTPDDLPAGLQQTARARVTRVLGGYRLLHMARSAVSLPGGRVATGGLEGRVVVWDLATGDALAALEDGLAAITALAAAGEQVLVGTQDGHVLRWDPATERSQTLGRHASGSVKGVLLEQPDRVLSWSSTGEVIAWKPTGGSEQLSTVVPEATNAAYAPRTRRVGFYAKGRGSLGCRSLGQLDRPWQVSAKDEGLAPRIPLLGWTEDEQYFVAGDERGQIAVWKTATWKRVEPGLRVPPEGIGGAYDLLTLPHADRSNGARFVSLHRGGAVLWSAAGQAPIATYRSPWPADCLGAALLPDREQVVVVGRDSPRVWAPETNVVLPRAAGHSGPVHGVAFARTGESVYSFGADGTAYRWDPQRPQRPTAWRSPGTRLQGGGEPASGEWLVVTSDTRSLRLLGAAGQEVGGPWPLSKDPSRQLESVQLSANGAWLAAADDAAGAWLVDLRASTPAPRPLKPPAGWGERMKVAVANDGRTAVGDAFGQVWITTPGAESLNHIERFGGPVRDVAISPDGTRVLSCGSDGSRDVVRLWRASGEPSGPFALHGVPHIMALALVPGSELGLVTQYQDPTRGAVLVLDLSARQIQVVDRIPLELVDDAPRSLAVSLDGEGVAVGTLRGVVLELALRRR